MSLSLKNFGTSKEWCYLMKSFKHCFYIIAFLIPVLFICTIYSLTLIPPITDTPYNGLIQIFIGMATIYCTLLAMLSAFSVYEKIANKNKLEKILIKLSLISPDPNAKDSDNIWEMVREIDYELCNYKYTYHDFKKIIYKIKKSYLYCTMLLINIFLCIATSFWLFIINFDNRLVLMVLLILLIISGLLETIHLLKHIFSYTDEYVDEYPTLKSIKTIRLKLKTRLPNVLQNLPIKLFANSTFFEIYDFDKLPQIFSSNIKSNAENSYKSVARLILPINFNIDGSMVLFQFGKFSYEVTLENSKKIYIPNQEISVFFAFSQPLKDLTSTIITINSGNKYNIAYSKRKPQSNQLLPILFTEHPLNYNSKAKFIDCDKLRQ